MGKYFGGSARENAFSMQQTSDDGYIIAGTTTLLGGNEEKYLIKTDEFGNKLWSTTDLGRGQGVIRDVLQISDGYILAGYASTGSSGNWDSFLIKTDENGRVVWENHFGGATGGSDAAHSVKQTSDGYIITGHLSVEHVDQGCQPPFSPHCRYLYGPYLYVAKKNSNGNDNWEWRSYFENNPFLRSVGNDIQQTSDGGYIIGGYSINISENNPQPQFYLVKIRSDGSFDWRRDYGTQYANDIINSVIEVNDGYLVLGESNLDIRLMKIDQRGNQGVWWTFRGSGDDRGYSIQQTSDGGYVMTGILNNEVWLKKIFLGETPSLCANGKKDEIEGETDVDCGGICVAEGKRCAIDQGCSIDHDCVSNYCNPDTNQCTALSDDTSRGSNPLPLNIELSETLNLTDKTDWWSIEVPESQYPNGGSLSVLLKLPPNQDFDLQILDSNSNSLCHQVSRTNSVESCNLSIPPGRYSVKVYTINSIGSYLINNTFIPFSQPQPPPPVLVPVENLQEKLHDADTICINWSHPSPISVNLYSVQEIVNNNALTPQYRALPEFCNTNPYLADTNVTFNVSACNIVGCSEPRYISIKTDPVGCSIGIGGGAGARVVGGGCDLQITDFAVTSQTVGTEFQVVVSGSVESQLGTSGVSVQVDILPDLGRTPIKTGQALIIPIGQTRADFEYVWIPEQSQYEKTFFIKGMARLFLTDKEDMKIKEIKLSLLKDKKICVDPGHGGTDTGNRGFDDMFYNTTSERWQYDNSPNYPNEKDFNLFIAQDLRDMLRNNQSNVIMTRDSDITVNLDNRAIIANSNNCEIFVSIHQNADAYFGTTDPRPDGHGTETYHYPGSINSNLLANSIHNKLIQFIRRYNRGVKSADFHVLRETSMPATLAEVAFSSNDIEFNLLNTSDFRRNAALGIFYGIRDYFANKGLVVLEIQTTLAVARSPFTIVASVSDGFGNPTNIINDKKLNESNFEVYLALGGLPKPEDKVGFTLKELALGLYEFTITPPENVGVGETLDLYISVVDKTQPEGQQLAGVDAVTDAVYIADPEGRPVVNLVSPLNNTVVKEGSVSFVYRVNDERRIESCSLIVNGEIRAVDNELIRDLDDSFELELGSGDYTWRVECRDDNGNVGSSPSYNLHVGFCGNNILDQGEECDDGNTVSIDGCSSECKKEEIFIRGDSNIDGGVDISDAVRILLYLFTNRAEISCLDAADSNDDGKVDISDPQYLLNSLFRAGSVPPEPFSNIGIDLTEDTLTCAFYNVSRVSGTGSGGGSVQTVKEALESTKNNKNIDKKTKSFLINYLESIPRGNISISSSPSSASIYLDEKYRGLTPRTIAKLTAGNYNFKLIKSGYPNYQTIVNIQPGKVTTISAALKPSPSPSPSLSQSPTLPLFQN